MTLKDNIKWIVSLSRGYRKGIALNISCGVVGVCLAMLFVYLSKSLIDRAVARELDGEIWIALLQIGAVILFQQLFSYLRGRSESFTSVKIMNGLRERLFYRVMQSVWSGKERFHTGDITTRLDGDLRKVSEALSTTIPAMIVTSFEFLFSFLFMLSLDSRIAWAVFFIMPIFLLISKRYMLRIRTLTHSIREVDSSLQSHIQEQVQHRSVVSSMGSLSNSLYMLRELSDQLLDKTMNRTLYSLYSRTVVRFGFAVGYLTIFFWGVEGLNDSTVTFGVMTAFLQLVSRVQVPVVEISSHISTLAQTTSAIDRLSELDDLEIESEGSQIVLDGKVGVRFSSVTFGYDERQIFSGFNFDFIPNQLHLIVGESGVGKSTMLRLILGFLTPSKGKIVIYNSDGSEVCSSLTRSNFVYVPQGNTLMSGTIHDNIVCGCGNVSDEKIREVLHVAVADFVYDLADGLDTICGERGAGLSEGEAQRIAIARGLLREGGVLLLDEPTSALDSVSAELLVERLSGYAKNRTIIMVTHRDNVSKIGSSVINLNI